MKNRVLHVIPTLKKDGAETQLVILLRELKKSILSIDLVTFDSYSEGKNIKKDLVDLGIEIYEYKKNILSTILFLYKKIKKGDYDLVHSHLPRADIAVGIVSILLKSKHIISVHAQYGTRKNESKVKYFFSFPVWIIFVNKSDKVIAISEKVRSWLTSNKVIKDIDVILYGVVPKTRFHSQENNQQIGMAARFLPWKGWVNLLDVTAFLNGLGFSFNLHFAGPDDIGYKEELRLLVKNKGLEEIVVFHDEFEDIYEFFDLVNIFIFLSESEGFGLVLLEAMSYGVPIICSDIAPINEFVDLETGILVDRNDTENIANKIIQLLSNPEELFSMQEKQKIKVAVELNAHIMATKVKELYYLH